MYNKIETVMVISLISLTFEEVEKQIKEFIWLDKTEKRKIKKKKLISQ